MHNIDNYGQYLYITNIAADYKVLNTLYTVSYQSNIVNISDIADMISDSIYFVTIYYQMELIPKPITIYKTVYCGLLHI